MRNHVLAATKEHLTLAIPQLELSAKGLSGGAKWHGELDTQLVHVRRKGNRPVLRRAIGCGEYDPDAGDLEPERGKRVVGKSRRWRKAWSESNLPARDPLVGRGWRVSAGHGCQGSDRSNGEASETTHGNWPQEGYGVWRKDDAMVDHDVVAHAVSMTWITKWTLL